VDLGIEGRKALICASTKGLGFACAEALAREGVEVFINGRNAERLNGAVVKLRAANARVTPVLGDVTSEVGRAALLVACPEPDILVNNNGGPEPRDFFQIEENDWLEAIRANMIAPLLLIRAVLPGMRARGFGRIINITSAMVTTPRPHMALSSAARGGLTVAAKGQSFAAARDNVTINNLLPERIDTDRQQQMAQAAMTREGIDYAQARARQVESIAAGRLGRPEEFGATCAFLCSVHAGFISGQNIHLDGGSYPALV
jgi:3-oxoacyl-[acyl-carrier protein] reductase